MPQTISSDLIAMLTGPTCFCPPPPPLRIIFDDINVWAAQSVVNITDLTDVSQWNNFFNFPTYGNAFTSVEIIGNEAKLFGGSNITLRSHMFRVGGRGGQADHVVQFLDEAECIVDMEPSDTFSNQVQLTTVNLPSVVNIVERAFAGCTSLTSVNVPLAQFIGDSAFTGDPISTFTGNSVVTILQYGFMQCLSLTTVLLPNVLAIGQQAFNGTPLSTFSIPSCTDLGGSTGDDNVFYNVIGQTVALTVPSALMSCDGGNPDGDILTLMANNTVNLTIV